jgi:V/A-type H+-transporting ATPase subunit D
MRDDGKKAEVTRPTKIELARLKRRLKLATRIQKIIKDRLSILIMEFFQTVRECTSIKERLLTELSEAYRAFSLTVGYHGSVPLEKELLISEVTMKVYGSTRNVGGVWLPLFEIEPSPTRQTMSNPTDTSSLIDHTTRLSQKLLERIVELAELQRSLELLGLEINKVKRINNALEHVLIPALEATIKYLAMKFEEREREEVARLKRVKLLIEQREVYAH